MVADYSLPKTEKGKTHGPSGLNGVGKLIITNTTIGHTVLIEGIAKTDGYDTSEELEVVKKRTGHSFE